MDFSIQAKDYDQDFIRVSSHALNASVVEESHAWVRALSQAMRELDTATLVSLRDRITSHDAALHKEPATLEELKQVLNTVAKIRNESMGMELQYTDLEERFRTRVMYAQGEEDGVNCTAEFNEALVGGEVLLGEGW